MNPSEFKETKVKILELLAADKLEEAIALLFTRLEQHAKKNELLKYISFSPAESSNLAIFANNNQEIKSNACPTLGRDRLG